MNFVALDNFNVAAHHEAITTWVRANTIDPSMVPLPNLIAFNEDNTFTLDVWDYTSGAKRLSFNSVLPRRTATFELLHPWPFEWART